MVSNMWFHPLHPPGFWGCWIWTVDGIHSPSCRRSGCCTDVAPTPEEEAHSAGKTGKHGWHTTLEGQSPNWGCTKMYSPTCMSYAILKCYEQLWRLLEWHEPHCRRTVHAGFAWKSIVESSSHAQDHGNVTEPAVRLILRCCGSKLYTMLWSKRTACLACPALQHPHKTW